MKRVLFLLFFVAIILPINVNAYEVSEDGNSFIFNICKEGCEYNKIPEDFQEIPMQKEIHLKLGEGTYSTSNKVIDIFNYDLFIEGIDKEKTNIEIERTYIADIPNVKLKNITFTAIETNEEIYEFIELRGTNNIIIENVNIEGEFVRGLSIESNSEESNGYINNLTIKGATEYGLYIAKRKIFKEKGYKVLNSSLENNFCSLLIETNQRVAQTKNNKILKPKLKLLSNETNNNYNLILENNVINCIAAGKNEETTVLAPKVYIPANNIWTKSPKENENIFEYNGGEIKVEQESQEKLVLNKDTNKKITDIFKEVEEIENAEWKNSNPEVAIIENNEIKPLSVGTTEFTTHIRRIEYKIDVEVTSDMLTEEIQKPQHPIQNPQTSNFINFIILTIFGLTSFGVYLTSYKKRNNN